MKKILALSLALLTIFCFAACGSTEEDVDVVGNVVTKLEESFAANPQEDVSIVVYAEESAIYVEVTMEAIDDTADLVAIAEAVTPALEEANTTFISFIEDLREGGVEEATISVDYYTSEGTWIIGTVVE